MKRILFSLLLLPFFAKAQNVTIDSTSFKNTPRKANFSKYKSRSQYSYSIATNLFSIEEFPKILNQVNSEEYKKLYASGLMLKFNDNQISYRISGTFYSDNISFDNECADCEKVKGKVSDNALRVGFEKNFMYSVIQPYFGFDMGFRRNIFRGSAQDGPNSNVTYPSYDVKTQKNGFSLAPLFGIKVNPINHLTLAIESSIDLLYSYEKQEKNYYGVNTNPAPSFSDFKKWEFLFKPIGMLSLQYNFGLVY